MSQISRPSHCLKREKTLAIPRHFIFFDTETSQEKVSQDSTEQSLRLGWACYYRRAYGRHLPVEKWCEFKDAGDFWQFVFDKLEKKSKLWLIARNIDFDFTICEGWRYLGRAGFKLKFFHNSEMTTVITVTNNKGTILFCDSLNWFRESLAETGKRIGLPKLSINFKKCSEKYLSRYCHRDVEIELKNFKEFITFLTSNQIGRLRYTIASTAMSAFLYTFSKDKIYIHNNSEAIDMERDSYKGGRTECFYIGSLTKSKFYVLDVNSLYPFVMRNNFYPVKYQQFLHKLKIKELSKILKHHSVITDCLIDTPEPVYALKSDRTIFPTGVFRVTLTTPELKYALKHNHIVETFNTVVYRQAKIFTNYVDKLYSLRMRFKAEGNALYTDICKLLLNSLYGKFGQKSSVWRKIGDCENERDRVEVCYIKGQNTPRQLRYLLGEIFELVKFKESFNSFPAIASHVTAYGRLCLYELMKAAGQGNYYYCDTDSLIVNEVGLCRLKNRINNISLGSLKVELTATSLTIRGLKDYSIGKKLVVKGISSDAEKLAEGVYRQSQWPSLKGLLRTGDVNVYVTKTVFKCLERKYTKGIINADGSVKPFALDESNLPF